MADRIEIQVNGETRRIADGQSVTGLIRDLDFDPRKVAVERNLEIVPRSTFDQVILTPGDRLEIVHFVGGGRA